MYRPQVSLITLLMWFLATPLWLVLVVDVPNSSGWGNGMHRFVMAPLVLLGITVAIQRLLRGRNNAWGVSALFAGIVTFAVLSLARWMAS